VYNLDEFSKNFLKQQKIVGYTKGLKPQNITLEQKQILQYSINLLPPNGLVKLPSIDEKYLKESAIQFYNERFNVHNIKFMTGNPSNITFTKNSTDEEKNNSWNSILTDISPYQLPLKYLDGHSMIGEMEKIIPLVEGLDMSCIKNIAFNNIKLGNNLTLLSIATYIHEIAHTQTESIKGYAENYYNKEVISIFLEKLAASTLDENKELLKLSEHMRFRHLIECIYRVYNYYYQNNSFNLNYKDLLSDCMYIESTLKATKLFDIYESERKEKNKRKIIYSIQDIFDGKIQVEELLLKNNITKNNSQNLLLVKKRLKK